MKDTQIFFYYILYLLINLFLEGYLNVHQWLLFDYFHLFLNIILWYPLKILLFIPISLVPFWLAIASTRILPTLFKSCPDMDIEFAPADAPDWRTCASVGVPDAVALIVYTPDTLDTEIPVPAWISTTFAFIIGLWDVPVILIPSPCDTDWTPLAEAIGISAICWLPVNEVVDDTREIG